MRVITGKARGVQLKTPDGTGADSAQGCGYGRI